FTPLGLRLVAQCTRKPSENPGSERAVFFAEPAQGVLQEGDDVLIPPGDHPDESPSVAECGAGEPLPKASRLRQLGRLEKRSGSCSVPLPGLSFSEAEKEFATSLVVLQLAEVEHLERHGVEPGCLLVREERKRAISGALGVAKTFVEIACGDSVV